jgi:hypothetical protein
MPQAHTVQGSELSVNLQLWRNSLKARLQEEAWHAVSAATQVTCMNEVQGGAEEQLLHPTAYGHNQRREHEHPPPRSGPRGRQRNVCIRQR